jgi:2-phospho-L-lactate transferase/gluconeogenesis factor (CofD/UPF0052 family)
LPIRAGGARARRASLGRSDPGTEALVAPIDQASPLLRVVMFSGGRGSASISRALIKNPDIQLTNIINAYDDGLSTGRLRFFLPGFLGPSDVRKNITTLMPIRDRELRSLRALLEYRFPMDQAQEKLERVLLSMRDAEEVEGEDLRVHWLALSMGRVAVIRRQLTAFLDLYQRRKGSGATLDLRDASLGNLLMTGEYLIQGQSFNAMIESFAQFCESRGRVLNVTEGENLFLVALKEDGTLLESEAQVVGPQNRARIKGLYLIPEPMSPSDAERLRGLPMQQRERELESRHVAVKLGEEARGALAQADVIIYAPGTQNSSLLPSYLTVGVGEAIAGNTAAKKIFVSNIREDHEIPEATANALVESCVRYLNRRGDLSHPSQRYITDLFAHRDISNVERQRERDTARVYFNFDEWTDSDIRVVESDWEQSLDPGIHIGDRIATEVMRVAREVKPDLPRFHYSLSIIVPVWNEENRISATLHGLRKLDLSDLDLSWEIVVVDGGSTDRTVEQARASSGVKVHRLPAGRFGKGAAIRYGLERTVSDLVVIFPGDDEYPAEGVRRVLEPILSGICDATLGARNLRPYSNIQSLKHIYQGKLGLRLSSLLGGRLLSVVAVGLYGRFISDPLTSLRAFRGRDVRGLAPQADGFDYDQAVLGELPRRDIIVLEVPVGFRPRTRAEGKKIRTTDGLRALATLVATRFRPQAALRSGSAPSSL